MAVCSPITSMATPPYYNALVSLEQGVETPLQYLLYKICHHLCLCLLLGLS